MKKIFFPDWQPIRDALEHAYKELGLEMIQDGPGSAHYDETHWNIAGVVRQYVIDKRSSTTCVGRNCGARLDINTLFRCFDCKAPLCEICAPIHFGPNHASRASAAHRS